jgi:TRAP-type C4-dicarboxylate transport system substrate-binding protein
MAIDKKAFDKISRNDQLVVREVMTKTYANFDKINLVDNEDAFKALIKSGIEEVQLNKSEFFKVRELLLKSNLKLGSEGGFSLGLYKEMLNHISDYRSDKVAASE